MSGDSVVALMHSYLLTKACRLLLGCAVLCASNLLSSFAFVSLPRLVATIKQFYDEAERLASMKQLGSGLISYSNRVTSSES